MDNLKTPYELFGWEIRKGWEPLVKELIDRLKKETDWDGEITQIKEKFGGLRFYIGKGSKPIWDLIDEYEKKSYEICEDCGKPGKLRTEGRYWIRTLCDEHDVSSD